MGRWGHAGPRMEAACEVQGGVQRTVRWGNVCKLAQLEAEQEEGRGSGLRTGRLRITKGL